jgi:hypothetical protein
MGAGGMRVLGFLPRYDLQKRVEKALSSAQFVVQTVGSAKECSYSVRRAHYNGVLVDSGSLDFKDMWNSSFEGLTNGVEAHISSLRSKVDRDFPQKLIRTKRGIGYTLTCMTASPLPGSLDRPHQKGRCH